MAGSKLKGVKLQGNTYWVRVTDVERAAANAQAEQTFAAIYGRKLPKGF